MSHYLPVGLFRSATADINRAKNARRIWFVTTNWFNGDVRANFDELEPDFPVQEVLGDCNRNWCYLVQLMEAPPLKVPIIFGNEVPFWGIDVETVTRSAVDVHLWWRAEKSPTNSYSIGLHLLDQSGNLIAQSDGAINEYGKTQVDLTTMQPGQIYIDYRTLNLPSIVAPGSYDLDLIVYNWQTGQRLTLPDGSDHLSLNTITVP
jgi:hypothetical protein